ncbi:MAG: phenylalanine--tRNA ligase subunit alpha [Acidimicrobiia bacterium]|nr:phenylalanine--tRNA ligase subunit alpha [Acidimicrobiia bacterium]
MSLDELEQLLTDAPERVSGSSSLDDLERLEGDLVGRRSLLSELRRSLGSVDPDQRPVIGARLNVIHQELTSLVASRRSALELAAENALLVDESVDVTLPGARPARGTHHLLTQTMDEVADIFRSLGYQVAVGPEIEIAWYNFDALNTPETHPSRFESDTLYVESFDGEERSGEDELLLRTHTSPMQARHMEQHDPPVYVVVPGRVFRSDTWDATHSPVFHQIEGLAVDEDITISDLKGTLAYFVREFFGADAKTRFIPHFFPFTEPSAEMHVWFRGGWLELLGCGMVDPNVFDAVGYDREQVTGFAFGMGAERLAMVRHGIGDIRHFYENDLRVLDQFR